MENKRKTPGIGSLLVVAALLLAGWFVASGNASYVAGKAENSRALNEAKATADAIAIATEIAGIQESAYTRAETSTDADTTQAQAGSTSEQAMEPYHEAETTSHGDSSTAETRQGDAQASIGDTISNQTVTNNTYITQNFETNIYNHFEVVCNITMDRFEIDTQFGGDATAQANAHCPTGFTIANSEYIAPAPVNNVENNTTSETGATQVQSGAGDATYVDQSAVQSQVQQTPLPQEVSVTATGTIPNPPGTMDVLVVKNGKLVQPKSTKSGTFTINVPENSALLGCTGTGGNLSVFSIIMSTTMVGQQFDFSIISDSSDSCDSYFGRFMQ